MGARRLGMLLLVVACSVKPAPSGVTTPGAGSATVRSSGSQPAVPPGTGSAGSAQSPMPVPPSQPSQPSGPAPGAPTQAVTLAEVGVEAASLDRSVDPCVDFYQFACGGWLATHPIPADQAGYSRFTEIEDRTKLVLRALLDDATKGSGSKLGDFYASCMDEVAIEKAGTTAVRPLLDKLQKPRDAKAWFTAVGELHKLGIWVVFGTTAEPDLKDSTKNITSLESAGLGLPDRDYYEKPELADQRTAYKQHVSRLLALAGIAGNDAAAADVFAIETELAKLTKTMTEKRDPQAAYNPTDMKALAKQAKGIDWKAYFKLLGVTPSGRLNVGTPKYFAALDRLRKQFKPAQWASYFSYHLLVTSALALPRAFDDEAFALEKVLTGVAEKPERYKRCIDATQLAVGELLGKAYVDKHFPEAAKQSATTLVDEIVKVMGTELASLQWMSVGTRKLAADKLAKLVRMVGYPDRWRSYDFPIKRDDFAGNRLRAQAAETRRVLMKSGRPVDRGEWLRNTFEVNAYYNPTANNSALLAGILQPPFFGANRSIAANMGGIGMVIGHELTHGFDDTGAQFDAAGNLRNWWAKDDQEKFTTRGKCVADQYSGFEAAPKQFVNGALTLGENIADLGGMKMAFKAYRALRSTADKVSIADGFSEDQVFFIAAGQGWCWANRPAEIQRRLTVDPHAPAQFRIYGSLRNLPEFAQAFSCAAGTPMRPTQTCSVW